MPRRGGESIYTLLHPPVRQREAVVVVIRGNMMTSGWRRAENDLLVIVVASVYKNPYNSARTLGTLK